jgi:hypothetical protein
MSRNREDRSKKNEIFHLVFRGYLGIVLVLRKNTDSGKEAGYNECGIHNEDHPISHVQTWT